LQYEWRCYLIAIFGPTALPAILHVTQAVQTRIAIFGPTALPAILHVTQAVQTIALPRWQKQTTFKIINNPSLFISQLALLHFFL